MKRLTPRQQEIVDLLREHAGDREPPEVRLHRFVHESVAITFQGSAGGVWRRLHKGTFESLARAGVLVKRPGDVWASTFFYELAAAWRTPEVTP